MKRFQRYTEQYFRKKNMENAEAIYTEEEDKTWENFFKNWGNY